MPLKFASPFSSSATKLLWLISSVYLFNLQCEPIYDPWLCFTSQGIDFTSGGFVFNSGRVGFTSGNAGFTEKDVGLSLHLYTAPLPVTHTLTQGPALGLK